MPVTKPYKQRFRFIGLRGKLLFATLTLIIFPLASLSYLKELELFLKNNHSQSIISLARTIASVFRDNSSLIAINNLTQSPHKALYSHTLKNKIIIDGYSNDWFALQNRQEYFKQSPSSAHNSLALLCANDENYYYFLVTVFKPEKQQQTFGVVNGQKKEHPGYITFQYLDYGHRIQEYRFKLETPGWTGNNQIQGEWQENNKGYTLEFKIPTDHINHYVAFKIRQANGVNDYNMPALYDVTSTSNSVSTKKNAVSITMLPLIETINSTWPLNPLITSDPLSTLRLTHLVPDNTRLWLLNKQHYVSAKAKKSAPLSAASQQSFSLMSLYRRLYLIIMDYPEQKTFYGSNSTQINNAAITKTLEGYTTADWLDNPHSDKLTLTVVTPVYDNTNAVIGTLVLEQTNDTLLALQDKTFERILLLTIFLFFSVAVTLLFFSSRLLKRIINLRNDTDRALSQEGDITNQLYRNDNDEIGDLARSFSTLLTRLEDHNQYLKTLSSKLSHELRTPLTIIKSSLENMNSVPLTDENPRLLLENNQDYATRAKEGCRRLNDLLNRMSEASRLEQSINTMTKENIEIVTFLANYIEAIQAVHPDLKIIFISTIQHQTINLSPELVAQLLDKLISNAISYHTIGTIIRIRLHVKNSRVIIDVNNFGELIDENKLSSIFNSLTSFRQKKNYEVHLGLGLYIAHLIAKFHNGRLEANNHVQEQSVSFVLSLPF